MPYGGQAHGCHAAALRAVWITTKLTGSDARLQISGDNLRGTGKNAFFRGLWRIEKLAQHSFAHVQHGKASAQLSQLFDYLDAFLRGQEFRANGALLGRGRCSSKYA